MRRVCVRRYTHFNGCFQDNIGKLVSICHTILDFPETAPLQDQVAKENSGDHCCQISYRLEDHRVANENGVKALEGHQSGRINVKVYYNDLSYDLPTTGNGLRKNNAGRVDCLEDSSTVDTPCHLSYQHRRHTLRPQFLVHTQEVDFNHLLLTTNTHIQASLRVFTDCFHVSFSLLEDSRHVARQFFWSTGAVLVKCPDVNN